MSDFANLSEVDSIFLFLYRSKDGVSKGRAKNNKHFSILGHTYIQLWKLAEKYLLNRKVSMDIFDEQDK